MIQWLTHKHNSWIWNSILLLLQYIWHMTERVGVVLYVMLLLNKSFERMIQWLAYKDDLLFRLNKSFHGSLIKALVATCCSLGNLLSQSSSRTKTVIYIYIFILVSKSEILKHAVCCKHVSSTVSLFLSQQRRRPHFPALWMVSEHLLSFIFSAFDNLPPKLIFYQN